MLQGQLVRARGSHQHPAPRAVARSRPPPTLARPRRRLLLLLRLPRLPRRCLCRERQSMRAPRASGGATRCEHARRRRCRAVGRGSAFLIGRPRLCIAAAGGGGGGGGSSAEEAQVFVDPSIHFDDPRLLRELRRGGAHAAQLDDFLTLLSVCHTVIPERTTGEDGRERVEFRASSPDEEALVKAARCLGYDLRAAAPRLEVGVTRSRTHPGAVRRFAVLAVNEFSSARKRMSVVVRMPGGQTVLLAKGADNVMFERARADGQRAVLDKHLTAFASEGLRTLVLAKRELSAAEAERWLARYREAANAIEGREELLAEAAEEIERDWTMVGATAIEDKLQEGVPETIRDLRLAKIKVWMLTGDKQETAINIGYACQLLADRTQLLVLDGETPGDAAAQLREHLARPRVRELLERRQCTDELAIVVEGTTLLHLLGHDTPTGAAAAGGPDAGPAASPRTAEEWARMREEAREGLLQLSLCCQCVVACRVSPKQKASIVKLIRDGAKGHPVTLAIGDGANDVNMIQTAHVGVGVIGQEGVQAVNASDYAIAQFRFLRELLMVHGRHNYRRLSTMILYSFYKNIALVFTLFLFNFDNGQSGTTFYDSIIKLSWNVFLAWPIIVFGVYDADVRDADARRIPGLYMEGPAKRHLNVPRFVEWIVLALVHGAIVYFVPREGFVSSWASDGKEDGLMVAGTAVFMALFMVTQFKCAMLFHTWNRYHHISLWGSIIAFIVFLPLYSVVYLPSPFYLVAPTLMSRPMFWLLALLMPVMCLLPDALLESFRLEFRPSLARLVAERAARGIRLLPDSAPSARSIDQHTEAVDSAAISPERPTIAKPGAARADAGAGGQRRRLKSVYETRGSGFLFSHPVPFNEYERQHKREDDEGTATP
mmetsp:Transcript_24661/g.79372  ORF Transcript_24661/g.79372 Transcript_24661/m.79372 type:complete len:887 (-) Transcript_24661:131-2791(-)